MISTKIQKANYFFDPMENFVLSKDISIIEYVRICGFFTACQLIYFQHLKRAWKALKKRYEAT